MISFSNFLLEASDKKGMGHSCIMLYYGSPHKDMFLSLKDKIDPEDLYGVDLGYGFETSPHVTVKYGIIEDDLDLMKDIIGKVDPIIVKTAKSFSLFENEKFDVLKISIYSKELREFNRRICRIFENEDKYPTYNPHTTIAYLNPGTGKKYIDMDSPVLNTFFTLKKLVLSDPESNKRYIKLS